VIINQNTTTITTVIDQPAVIVRPGGPIVVVDSSSSSSSSSADGTPLSDPAPVSDLTPATPVPLSDGDAGVVVTASAEQEALTLRYLDVKNDTNESITVWVQYFTPNVKGEWAWASADPLEREVKAGTIRSIRDDDDRRIQAAYIRIWVESASGIKWQQFKSADLALVGDKVPSKKPTFTFTVANADKKMASK
jgi:hypothetical protein